MAAKVAGRTYREVNRDGWAKLVAEHSDSSCPYSDDEFSRAREILDPDGWLEWSSITSVLCLACGGGQQAALFASLGCTVTSFDLCVEQLELDKRVAHSRNLSIECLQGDMLDLTSLYGRKFDLIYQAVSACYIPEVLPLCEALWDLLPEGGSYWVEHWNPMHIQLEDLGAWNGSGYKIVRPQLSGVKHEWVGYSDGGEAPVCWHFIHSLSQLIGGLCTAGFIIEKFVERAAADLTAEPGSHAHLAAYVPPFFAMLARRRGLR
jgi:SAM-dependent methyltransferase